MRVHGPDGRNSGRIERNQVTNENTISAIYYVLSFVT